MFLIRHPSRFFPLAGPRLRGSFTLSSAVKTLGGWSIGLNADGQATGGRGQRWISVRRLVAADLSQINRSQIEGTELVSDGETD
jgi:hypothetical protein